MKRKLLLCLLLFLVLIGATLYYINKVFLPVQLKSIIEEKASVALNCTVQLEALQFNPVKGVIIRNLQIFRQDKPEELFVHIKQASFHLLYTPLLTQKKVIIPSITVETPSLHLIRDNQNYWNIQDLLKVSQEKGTTKDSDESRFMIGNILITDGRVKVTQTINGQEETEFIDNIHMDTALSLKKGAEFLLKLATPSSNGQLTVNGNYAFLEKTLNATVKFTNIAPHNIQRFLPPNNLPVWRNGLLETGNLEIIHTETQDSISGTVKVSGLDMTLPNGDIIQGNLEAGRIQAQKTNDTISFKGVIESDTIQLTRPDGTSAQTKLSVQVTNAVISPTETVLDIAPKLSSIKATLPSGQSFSGALSAERSQITLGSGIRIHSDFNAGNITAAFSPDGLFEGSVSSPAAHIQIEPDGNMTIEGSYTLNAEKFHLSADQHITGILDLHNISLIKKDQEWRFVGKSTLTQSSLSLGADQSVTGNFSLDNATVTYTPSAISLNGNITAENASIQAGPRSIKGQFTLNDTVLRKEAAYTRLVSNINTTQAEVRIDEKTTFFGSPEIHISLEQPSLNAPWVYSGKLLLVKGLLRGLPKVEQITDLSGTIQFQNDQLRSENLSFNVLNTPFTIKGSVKNFNDPEISAKVNSPEIDLSKIQNLFPELFQNLDLKVTGYASAFASFNGKPSALDLAEIGGETTLKSITLESSKLPEPVTQLNGKITYTSNLVKWDNLSGTWKGQSLTLSGQLADFKRPSITTSIKGADLSADAKLTLLRSGLDILSLKGTYAGQTFDTKGELSWAKDSIPSANLTILTDLNLKELKNVHASLGTIVEDNQLDGNIHLEVKANGPLSPEWTLWNVSATARSNLLNVKGYALNDALLSLIMTKQKITKLHITGLFYEGRLDLLGSSDLITPGMPYDIALRLENSNIKQLKTATPLKTKNISGYLSTTFVGKGLVQKADAIEGKGSINIAEGLLWELDMFKGLLSFLLIPEYKDIIFTDAKANFEVKNKQVVTDTLELYSPKLTLAGKGIINFDQSLNMHVIPKLDPTQLIKSESLKKGPTALLLQSDQLFSIHITGTMQRPKYEIDKALGKVIGNATGVMIDGVKSIFGEIF